MSRSQQQLSNPAAHLYEWNGEEGSVYYYDKEEGKNVPVKLPLEMLVLDQLNGVAGFNESNNTSIWSNETRSTKDTFTVRAGKRVLYTGPYKVDGISQVAGFGGKYAKIVYFITPAPGGFMLNRFKFTGAAVNAWIEFSSNNNVENGKVVLTGSVEGKKGKVVYQMPTFEYKNASTEEDAAAIALDRDLQVYLNQYLTAKDETDEIVNGHEDTTDSYNTDGGKASPEQQADFARRKAEKISRVKEFLENEEFADDEAIDRYQDISKDELNNLFPE